MNNIKWEDGAVCYALNFQWRDGARLPSNSGDGLVSVDFSLFISERDFQLNEIRTGDYIKTSELDTEQKFNDAVEVFELFGFSNERYTQKYMGFKKGALAILVNHDYGVDSVSNREAFDMHCKRKITYPQLMAIGKLKRAMIELEKSNPPEIPDSSKRNKSKQAYEILKSLDYDYDLVKQRWFKKHYI